MARAGFSIKPRHYIPKSRKSESTPPMFYIRRLNPLELQDISERISPDETIELGGISEGEGKDRTVKVSMKTLGRLVKAKYAVLEEALSGWENVEDEDGPVSFSKEAIRCLDPDIVNELSDVAQGTITEEEAKNSESPLG